jgi:hypothetical protein
MNSDRLHNFIKKSRQSAPFVVVFAASFLAIAGCGERSSRVVTENDQWTFEDVRRMSGSDSEGGHPQKEQTADR